ncbi:MAG: HAMP domain-containing sensor histidine kinase [Candidatus Sericytochromatia bacterium]|nr:HAMP domain-containing sensor histidine kinase [Candidatus Sericytochromatia bacterium]
MPAGSGLSRQHLDVVSHEFRTPLNFIVGFGSLLADGAYGELPPAAREAVARILDGAERLTGLVDDLLEQTRLASGDVAVELAQADCGALVRHLAEEFGPVAHGLGLRLTHRVADDLPVLHSDPQRLHQALRHLVRNALKFTPKGGEVHLAAEASGGRVRLVVRDTGIGIPRSCLARIFDRFYQVDGSTTRHYGGAGLGLAIARGIVDALGGVIHVASELNRGTTFTVSVPVRATARRR